MRSVQTKILLFALPLSLVFACAPEKPKLLLPVYGEKKAEGKDTVYHQVADFSLTDQNGQNITSKTVDGKIYVANFFFATCQSICPEMSTNLVDVQEAFKNDDSLLILSHSVNP